MGFGPTIACREPVESQIRALEDLLSDVRESATKPHVREAIAAHDTGATRCAMVSTRVAVSLDLVAKIRELADHGDTAAARRRDALDAAVTAGDRA